MTKPKLSVPKWVQKKGKQAVAEWKDEAQLALDAGRPIGEVYGRAGEEVNQTKKGMNAMRHIPVRTVIKRHLRRDAAKSMNTESVLKTLSALTKSLIQAETTAALAAQDLDDLRYTQGDSVQSAYQMAPRIIKALKVIDAAKECTRKANEYVAMAKDLLRSGGQ